LLALTTFAATAREDCATAPWLDWFAQRIPPEALSFLDAPPAEASRAEASRAEVPPEPPLPAAPAFAAPVPWLDWTAQQVGFALAEAEEEEEVEVEVDKGALAAEPGLADAEVVDLPEDPRTELTRVRREMQSLRSELRMLQVTLDTFMNDVASTLREENTQLRAEVQRIYALEQGDPQGVFPTVPRPGGEIVDQVINDAVERAMAEHAPQYAPQPQSAPLPEFTYTILSEYGREPDNPGVLEGNAPSLKGMVIVVPSGSYREDVVNLGKELRARFERYDNINIEVFDETLAAQSFAETNISTGPEHRILSVSRHKASGRDVIVYLQDGIATEVE
jgi:hypothetical protein